MISSLAHGGRVKVAAPLESATCCIADSCRCSNGRKDRVEHISGVQNHRVGDGRVDQVHVEMDFLVSEHWVDVVDDRQRAPPRRVVDPIAAAIGYVPDRVGFVRAVTPRFNACDTC